MDSFPFIPTALAALRRHSLVVAVSLISASLGSILYLLVTPPQYQSSARIMLEEGEETVSDLGRSLTDLDSPGAGADPLATQSELISSEQVLSRAIQKLEAVAPSVSLDVEDLRDELRVRIVPATNILEIIFEHRDPEIAAAAVNAIVESTAEINGEEIREEASLVRNFLEDQLPEQEARVAQAETAESQFRQKYSIVSLEAQVDSLVENLSEVEAEERQTIAQLQELRERAGLLQQVTGTNALQDAYASVQIGQDEPVNNLRNQLVNLEASIVETGSRLGPQHPELLALIDQRNELAALYQNQIAQRSGGASRGSGDYAFNPLSQDLMTQLIADQIEFQSLQERLAAIRAEKANLQARLSEIPAISRPLSALGRERLAAEQALENLRTNLEEARLAEAQLVSNIRILGEAYVPSSPSEPSVAAVILLGLAAGALLAVASVVLLEAFDNKLHNPREAELMLGLPVLGTLPPLPMPISGQQDLNAFLDNQSLVGPYHSLMKALQYHLESHSAGQTGEIDPAWESLGVNPVHHRTKTLVFSSTFWGEGKSTVVRNLAAVTSMFGQKTLIVDADLRTGSQSQFFGLKQASGLSDAITENSSILDFCQKTQLSNLSVLPQGQSISRPSAVIESPIMSAALDEAANHYDWAIIDASPVTVSSDLITLSQQTEGLILVVRPDLLSRYEIQRAILEFKQSGGHILGLIYNEAASDEISFDASSGQRSPALAYNGGTAQTANRF